MSRTDPLERARSELAKIVRTLVEMAGKRGYTIESLAGRIGCHRTNIHKTMAGKPGARTFNGGHLMRLCEAAGAERKMREEAAIAFMRDLFLSDAYRFGFAPIDDFLTSSDEAGRIAILRGFSDLAEAMQWPGI